MYRLELLWKREGDKTSQVMKFDSWEIFSFDYDVLLSKTHSVTTLHNFHLQCWNHSGDRNDSKSISSFYNQTAFSILLQHHFTFILLHKICLYVIVNWFWIKFHHFWHVLIHTTSKYVCSISKKRR